MTTQQTFSADWAEIHALFRASDRKLQAVMDRQELSRQQDMKKFHSVEM